MGGQRVPGGVVHKLPVDLRKALIANATALDAWKDITPLARNEFICWVEDAKQETTRERRIRRTQEELEEGQRRPCCWPGCKHRERNGREGVSEGTLTPRPLGPQEIHGRNLKQTKTSGPARVFVGGIAPRRSRNAREWLGATATRAPFRKPP